MADHPPYTFRQLIPPPYTCHQRSYAHPFAPRRYHFHLSSTATSYSYHILLEKKKHIALPTSTGIFTCSNLSTLCLPEIRHYVAPQAFRLRATTSTRFKVIWFTPARLCRFLVGQRRLVCLILDTSGHRPHLLDFCAPYYLCSVVVAFFTGDYHEHMVWGVIVHTYPGASLIKWLNTRCASRKPFCISTYA